MKNLSLSFLFILVINICVFSQNIDPDNWYSKDNKFSLAFEVVPFDVKTETICAVRFEDQELISLSNFNGKLQLTYTKVSDRKEQKSYEGRFQHSKYVGGYVSKKISYFLTLKYENIIYEENWKIYIFRGIAKSNSNSKQCTLKIYKYDSQYSHLDEYHIVIGNQGWASRIQDIDIWRKDKSHPKNIQSLLLDYLLTTKIQ